MHQQMLFASLSSGSYTIENALMFDGSADKLELSSPGTESDTKKGTLSFWVKRAKLGVSAHRIISHGTGGGSADNTWFDVRFENDDKLHINTYSSARAVTTQVFRDTTAWYHIVVRLDTTDGTADDRLRIYVNGSQVTFGTRNNFSEDDTTAFSGNGSSLRIGDWGGSHWFNGYFAEFIQCDGQSLGPDSFGEFDDNGVWVPINPSVTFGNNGFWLEFKDANDPGKDSSGNTGHQRVTTTSGTWANASGFSQFDATKFDNGTPYNDARCFTLSSTGDRFTYDHGSGNSLALSQVGMANDNGGGNSAAAKWKVEYSDNGSDWTDTTQFCDYTDGGESSSSPQYATITGQSAHRYWAWEVVVDRKGGPSHGTYEVELYEQGASYWTATSIAATQQVTDSPTDDADDGIGNYWTLNPLASTDTLTNGNLAYTGAGNWSSYVTAPALPMTGKWYWEIKAVGSAAITSSANWDTYVGVVSTDVAIPTASHTGNANLWVWGNMAKDGSGANGAKHNNSNVPLTPAVNFGDNAIVMIAVDMDNNSIWFGNDGTWAGSGNPAGNSNAAFSTLSGQVMPFQSLYSDSATYNFGATDFAHTPPTGFKALNTANLPAPTVTPSEFFQVLDHTHDGSSSTFTLNWDPTVHDTMIMFKDQDDNSTPWYYSQTLYLGLQYPKRLPNSYLIAGSSQDTNFVSVSGTTITVGSTLPSSDYAVYCWRFGQISSRVSNSVAGAVQIASTTSVASHGGAGLCLYEGVAGASDSVAKVLTHGMGASGIGWFVYENWEQAHSPIYMHSGRSNRNTHTITPATGVAESNQFGYLFGGGTYPTGATLSCGSQLISDGAGKDLVLWMFNEVAGFIDIGVYTGTGNTTGPVIQTGFSPALIIIRRNDASTTWVLRDNLRSPRNPSDENLAWNLDTDEDASGGDIDFLANGFRPVQNEATVNASGGTYEYICFASQPFGGTGVAQAKAR